MKKRSIYALICLIAASTLLLSSCTTKPETTVGSDNTTISTDGVVTAPPTASSGKLTITLGSTTVDGEGSVELKASRNSFRKGKTIEVTLPEGQHYVAFCLAKDVLAESILYVSGNKFEYTIPNMQYSYPEMSGATITARIPDASELSATRNLALNPADLIDPDMNISAYSYSSYWCGTLYPHVTTSSVCRYNADESSKYDFEARNAIDGFTQNKGHGGYPVQSWGPDNNFDTRKGHITVDFGREVKVDSLVLYIRADFPHDTFFKSAEIVFSDGSTQTIAITNSANGQTFDLGSKTTSSIKITKLTKDNTGMEWAGLMEIEVMGSELAG